MCSIFDFYFQAILELKWMTNANNLGNADKNRQIQIRINRNAGRFTRVSRL